MRGYWQTGLRSGEVPKAFIVLKEGAAASAEQIMAFVNEKVAPYKAIREVEFRKELPISSAGKVLKRFLKKNVNLLFFLSYFKNDFFAYPSKKQ